MRFADTEPRVTPGYASTSPPPPLSWEGEVPLNLPLLPPFLFLLRDGVI